MEQAVAQLHANLDRLVVQSQNFEKMQADLRTGMENRVKAEMDLVAGNLWELWMRADAAITGMQNTKRR